MRLDKFSLFMSEVKKFIDAIPSEFDTKLGKIGKSAYICGMAISSIDTYLSNRYKDEYCKKNNQQFVDAFFLTPLHKPFKIKRQKISDYETLVIASSKKFGTLYFTQYKFGIDGNYSPIFYHHPDFDFSSMLKKLWSSYHEMIHGEFLEDKYLTRMVYSPIVDSLHIFSSETEKKLNEFIKSNKKVLELGLSRTFLFYGPPGSGKSTFALKYGKKTNGRIMRLDANGLTKSRTSDLEFVLQNIGPDVIIVDDIDRSSDLAKTLPTLFNTLTTLKTKFPSIIIILTANNISKLDAALIRPGRVDELIEFKVPEGEEQRSIFNHFATENDLSLSEEDCAKLLKALDGLSHVFFKKVAEELRYKSIEQTLLSLEEHKKHLKTASEKK